MRDALIVYVAGMAGIAKAVPVGIALRMPPLSVFLMTVMGAYTSAAAIYTGRRWVGRFLAERTDRGGMRRKSRKIRLLASKYGVAGLGLIGTALVGSNLTVLLGLAVVEKKKALAVWVAAGIALWAAVFTAAGSMGFDLAARFGLVREIARLAGAHSARGGGVPW